LRERFARRLGPLAQRVRFLPLLGHSGFINLLSCSDVVLDTFPFGGCNSTAEALALGVPVVTLPAPYLKGRYSLALYRELGIESCIAATPEQYIDIALRLANEREARQSLSREIVHANDRLFDRPDAGLALGEALLGLAGAEHR
jgi:predicted O-linked N-acetylglucosamine transferase (SPINDLY family)